MSEWLRDETSRHLEVAFWEFHNGNPEIWTLFQKYTFQVIEAGLPSFGALHILSRIRWFVWIETKRFGDLYKINNNHAAFYARLFHREHPEHEGFFRTREREDTDEA